MARALRFEVENGWYHVTARGNERRAIFRDDPDRQRFLDLLGTATARFGLVLGAYVLMDNHYHLMLCTPAANLSRAMQWLNVRYTIAFNRRHKRVGHLFQGRFKSLLIDEEAWLAELSRYVHLNPVRVRRLGLDKKRRREVERGGVGGSETLVLARRDALRSYRWSSWRAYAGLAEAPEWLQRRRILEKFAGRTLTERQRAYRAWVEEALGNADAGGRGPWQQVVEGAVLGSEKFMEQVKRGLKALRGEKHRVKRVMAGVVDVKRVRLAVEKVKGEKWDSFANRHGDWGRDLYLWLARRRSGRTLGELAGGIEGLQASAVSEAVRRIEKRLARDRGLRQLARRMEELLNVET